MRRDSIFVFGFSVLVTIGIVGGAYYMSAVRPIAQADSRSRQVQPSPANPSVGNLKSSSYPNNDRTDQPIKCVDPEIGEFWTNASTCDGADLHNRLSFAKPIVTSPEKARYGNESYRAPGDEAKSSRTNKRSMRVAAKKPDLRSKAKVPPDGLPSECRFPVGQAAELERKMSAKDDPRDSMWLQEYCEWRCVVARERCPLPKDFYYYSYSKLCPTDLRANGCRN
jgi:hypothetical protein